MRRLPILFLGLCLMACGPSEPRSIQFFEANIDEAREIIAGCKDGTERSAECANADIAIQTAEGRERFKRFRGEK